MEALLKTEGLKKYFNVGGGKLHAVDDVNIEIARGQTMGIVGESGCGKSTLGRLVLRLLDVTAGSVYFEGRDILACSSSEMKKVRSQMQIVFQDPYASLNPRMSVYELIAEPLIMNHITRNKRELSIKVLGLMRTVGLATRFAGAYPHELDGGRRQRVGIARALALSPKFIVCDEPVSALDVSIQAQILNLLMDLQDEMGLTYMFITHDLSVVKHISDEITVMYLGRCVERATAAELFQNPLHPYTRALLSAIPVPQLREGFIRKIIRGEVSDPIDPAPGCRFAIRCEECKPECTQSDPSEIIQENGHFVACTLYA